MIAWTPDFPAYEKPLAYLRLLRARHRFYDHVGWKGWRPGWVRGDQHKLAHMRGLHRGERCFIIANGPSLRNTDVAPLRDEITIGCNGIYQAFDDWGWKANYLLFEDIEQLELRRREVSRLRGVTKLAAIYNGYAIRADADTLFFNAPRFRGNLYYWEELYPQFSRDFAAIAHLGSTITYLMLQWAYFLGCDPVCIVGLDHDYGELPKLFPPGKITITGENIEQIRGLHFSDQYYQVGDQIGVPDVEKQEAAYRLARDEFERDGRRVLNASTHTALDVFERVEYATLFQDGPV